MFKEPLIRKRAPKPLTLNRQLTTASSWVGIVKGAVLRGFGVGMKTGPPVTWCPRHYGISLSSTYEEWQHLGEQVVKDTFDGRVKVKDRMVWLVKKGDAILPPPYEPITQSYAIRWYFTQADYEAGKKVRVTFAATTYDDPPSSMAGLPRGMLPISSLRNEANTVSS